jgi:hypothetical protein
MEGGSGRAQEHGCPPDPPMPTVAEVVAQRQQARVVQREAFDEEDKKRWSWSREVAARRPLPPELFAAMAERAKASNGNGHDADRSAKATRDAIANILIKLTPEDKEALLRLSGEALETILDQLTESGRLEIRADPTTQPDAPDSTGEHKTTKPDDFR